MTALVGTLVVLLDCALGFSPMPFVVPNIYQGGFLPSAYLLSAPAVAVGALTFRDIAYPFSIIAARKRAVTERAVQVASCSALLLVQIALFKILLGDDLLLAISVIYGLLFLGITLIAAGLTTSSRAAFLTLTVMLGVFVVTPAGSTNTVLFNPSSPELWATSGLVVLVGLISAELRGLDRGRRTSGDLLGTNEF